MNSTKKRHVAVLLALVLNLLGCSESSISDRTKGSEKTSTTNAKMEEPVDTSENEQFELGAIPTDTSTHQDSISLKGGDPPSDTSAAKGKFKQDPLETVDYPWELWVVGKRLQNKDHSFSKRQFLTIGISDSCDVFSSTVGLSVKIVENEITGYQDQRIELSDERDHIFLIRKEGTEPVNQLIQTEYPTPKTSKAACALPRGIAVDKIGIPMDSNRTVVFGHESSQLKLTSQQNVAGYHRVTANIDGKTQELLPAYRWRSQRAKYKPVAPEVLWVGYLNDDSIPDIILKHSIYPEYEVGDFSLFVSHENKQKKIFEEVARTRSLVM